MGKQGRAARSARRVTHLTAATLRGIEAAVHWAVEQGFDDPDLAHALSFFVHVEEARANAVVLPRLSFVQMVAQEHVFESHEAFSEYDLGWREGWTAAVGGHLPRVLERELARRGSLPETPSSTAFSRRQHKNPARKQSYATPIRSYATRDRAEPAECNECGASGWHRAWCSAMAMAVAS